MQSEAFCTRQQYSTLDTSFKDAVDRTTFSISASSATDTLYQRSRPNLFSSSARPGVRLNRGSIPSTPPSFRIVFSSSVPGTELNFTRMLLLLKSSDMLMIFSSADASTIFVKAASRTQETAQSSAATE